MSRRHITHLIGFIVPDEHIASPYLLSVRPFTLSSLFREGVWLLWPLLTSAQSLQEFPPEALSSMPPYAVLSGSHCFVSRYRAQPFPNIAGTWSAGGTIRHFHRSARV